MPAYGVMGIDALRRALESLGREAKALPAVAARKLASMAVMAFTEPGLRPTPWKPLAASTLRRAAAPKKGKKGKKAVGTAAGAGRAMLVRTGNMKQGILAVGPKVVVPAKSKGYPYPAAHQFGSADGKRPPARPFIPVGKDGRMPERAERELLAGLKGELERAAKSHGL